MPPYRIACDCRGCPHPARWKIAAVWSDGLTSELKTYSMSCEGCREVLLAEAVKCRQQCRLAPGELLEQVQAYPLSTPRGAAAG